MKRKIIRIDEEKCDGCGDCITNCPEGALQIVEGKARLVRDIYCDGLGACIGHCPQGAILVEEREAEAYDEAGVMLNIIAQGEGAIVEHLKHLREHNETSLMAVALRVLRERNIAIDGGAFTPASARAPQPGQGCPGARPASFAQLVGLDENIPAQTSALTHWPIQLHLINPTAPHFAGSNLLLAADCVAYAMGDFHSDHLKNKTLAVACPKLDDGQEAYIAKLADLIDVAGVNSLTVMIMQVPCCSGLLRLAKTAADQAGRKMPIQYRVVGVRGEILQEGSV